MAAFCGRDGYIDPEQCRYRESISSVGQRFKKGVMKKHFYMHHYEVLGRRVAHQVQAATQRSRALPTCVSTPRREVLSGYLQDKLGIGGQHH